MIDLTQAQRVIRALRFRWLVLVMLIGAAGFAQQTYTLSTIAGGVPPPTPGSAINLSLGQPRGIATDAAGNVYFSSLQSIFKMDTSGNLTRIAGNARRGYTGDGGSGPNAQLTNPVGVAVDTAGDLYIADQSNNVIRKVTSGGAISTVAGNGNGGFGGDNGQATSAQLSNPLGVAVDTAGNLYIADTFNNRVRKVTSGGVITTFAGDGKGAYGGDGQPAISAQLNFPSAVAVDKAGNVYIADQFNNRIRKVTVSGVISTVAGNGTAGSLGDNGPATSAQLASPTGVAVDAAGNLYIASGNYVRKVTGGTISTVAGNGGIGYSGDGGPATAAQVSPQGVAVDSAGNLYIADFFNNRVRKVTSSGVISTVAGNGTLNFSGDGGPAIKAQLNTSGGIARDASGNLYITDGGTRVRKISGSGIITTIAGTGTTGFAGDNGPAASAQFSDATGLATDAAGNIYVADVNNNRIRQISPSGNITTVAGNGQQGLNGDNGPATSATLTLPAGVAVDTAGNLYIADSLNHAIRKVTPGGTITTVAGNGTQGYTGDGGLATSATLNTPTGVAVDAAGNIFIADTQNNVIREVLTNGTIGTVAGNGQAGYVGDGGPAKGASLSFPHAVAIDGHENLYISDSGNNVIRLVTPSSTSGSSGSSHPHGLLELFTGIIETIAGNGDAGYEDDDPADDGETYDPDEMAIDNNGNVDFVDQNNAVRQVSPGPAFPPNTPLDTQFAASLTITDPISPVTGEFYDEDVVFDLGGRLPLKFGWYYSTRLSGTGFSGSMGNNRMHNFEARLSVQGSNATVLLMNAQIVRFTQSGGTWNLQTPQQFGFQLISSAHQYQLLDPSNELIYTFSSSGTLASISDRNGNTLTVTQGASGPTEVADGLGRSLKFTYQGGKLTSLTDQSGRSITFAYTDNDLTSFTDANHATTTYSYVSAGIAGNVLAAKKLPVGNTPYTQTYNNQGQVSAQIDSFGDTTKIAYNDAKDVTTITDPHGNKATDTNEAFIATVQHTDALGHNTIFAYDLDFRRTLRTDALGNQTQFTYHTPSGYAASFTDATKKVTTLSFAAQTQDGFTFYNLAGITYPDGSSISYTYDSHGNRLSSTDALGKIRAYTYDPHGQVLSFTNEVGGKATYSYNADGTLASFTTPSGDSTNYGYDSEKRVVKIKYPDGSVRSFAYDADDHITTFTDERSQPLSVTYTANGALQSIKDALHYTASFKHDTNDRVTAVTDPLGGVTAYQYNSVSLPSSLTAPAGETRDFAYDSLNRLSTVSDASGTLLTLGYDAIGNVTSVADGLKRKTEYTFDADRRITKVMTPLGHVYERTFDSLSRIKTVTDPLSRVVTFSYDARGLITGISFPGGRNLGITRSDLGPVTGVTDPNGGLWSRQYDSSGRLASRKDPLGRVTSIAYDSRSRISGVTTPVGSLSFTYDPAGNLIRRGFSEGSALNFTVDSLNRVTGGNGFSLGYDGEGRIVNSNGLVISRDASGKITGVTYAPGKTVTYAYNSRGVLESVADWAGGLTKMEYDQALNLTSITRSNGVVTQIGYDGEGNLASMSTTGGSAASSIVIERDAANHVISSERTVPQLAQPPHSATQLGFDAADQISGATYDGLGRITSYAGRNYTWDLGSRLTGYSGGDGSATLTYDAFDLLTSRTSAGTTVNFVLNYALRLPFVAIERTAAADQRYYVGLPDGTLLYSIDAANNQRQFYHFDEAGNTIFLTNDQGAVTDSYGITPFGESVTHNGSSDNPYTWQGAFQVRQEGSTGLYYMRARYYDAATGRFLSKDPRAAFDPIQTNPYLYALNNPITYTDPLGLNPLMPAINWASNAVFQENSSYLPVVIGTELKDVGILGWQYCNFVTQQYTTFAQGLDAHFGAILDGVTTMEEAERVNQIYTTGIKTFKGLREVTDSRNVWYNQNLTKLEELEEGANKVRPLGTAGKVLAGIGIALDAGLTIHDGVSHGDSAGTVVLDTSATVIGDAAVLAAPPLVVADMVTLGGVSGGITNCCLAVVDAPTVIASDRVTTADAERIKRRWTRKPLLGAVWRAGEWIANKIYD